MAGSCAYYKWLNRAPSNRETENKELLKAIHLLYNQVDGIYGYRRITFIINRQRMKDKLPCINEKRVYHLMQISQLKVVIRRRRKNTRNLPLIMSQKMY
ncbi:IS3 family transposase [Solibacillus silvestris]|uniref:IS3 family transposase n=1 Tax=Solibacillus silvestris TaxID=76853 RepID=UPI003B28221E